MEKTIAELIQRSRPLTGTSSLCPSRSISPPNPKSPKPTPSPTTFQNPNPKVLKTLNHPTILTGTLTLPSHGTTPTPKCSCFQLYDGSAAPICCDILEFNPKILGEKIKITAWNFIPLKCNNGFLEIIRWDFLESSSGISSCYSNVDAFPLNSNSSIDSKECKDSSKARYFMYGALESVSPVSAVLCKGGSNSNSSSKSTSDSRNLCGFIVNMLVCECKLCGSKDLTVALRDLDEGYGSLHCFVKPVLVYFCGYASSWHPVMTRLVGNVILLSGLMKKLVYVAKEESQLMYVTPDKALLHLPKVPKRGVLDQKVELRGNGECGCYTGTVTGSYMQGMVVELDREVMLLLTDKQLSVPHSLRVGAIVSVKNVHFVNPRFSWTKILILGACLRTSINVESFSPLETGCHMNMHSQSLLGKFVDSLVFAARLWVLLLIASFKKMFAGILPEKDILGSKHKEGLAQKFSSSHLPRSVFQIRHGVFVDFWKHDSCGSVVDATFGHLKIVVPISILVSHCMATWMKMLSDQDTDHDFMGSRNLHTSLSCGGRSYAQPIKRTLHSGHIGVLLLGVLKISSSGRLQLVDATGSIDVLVSDLPSTWNSSRIYEIEDFNITMEGVAENMDQLGSLTYESLTCRSIFYSTPPVREMDMSLHLNFNAKDQHLKNCSCPFFLNWKDNSEVLESGTYHLLRLMHKFPVLQKFQRDQVISNKSSVFAEAIILSWDLVLAEKGRDIYQNLLSSDQPRDFVEHLTSNENGECVTLKRCKVDQSSNQDPAFGLSGAKNGLFVHSNSSMHTCRCSYAKGKCCNSNCPFEILCKITSRSVRCHSMGVLRCTVADARISSCCRQRVRKVFLEFNNDSFYLYQALRIGGYYILKHGKEDMSCPIKDHSDGIGIKVLITSGMHLLSASFSCDESIGDANSSSVLQSFHSFVTNNVVSKSEVLNSPETYSDINLSMPANVINYVKFDSEVVDGLFRQSFSVKEEVEVHNCHETTISASLQSFEISYPDNLLPAGNLVSLHGLVTAVHDCNQNSFAAHAVCRSPGVVLQPVLNQGTSTICIHIVMENYKVKIVGPLNKGAYPTGFGQGVHASFHRILELDGQNEYRMIPASFIVIDSASPFNEQSGDGDVYASLALGSESVTSPVAVPAVFVSELLQSVELKPIQLHCRVLAVYVLILEKTRRAPSSQTELSVFDIALAGFVLDDGTSSCCCWANHESAAALLRLHIEETPREACRRTFQLSKQTRVKQACGSTISRLNKIIQNHGRVIIKNIGSAFDYSCSDLTFSVSSEKIFSSSDEDFLRCLILNACFSTLWTVVGSLMDSNSTKQLETNLSELQMATLPLQNIWATGIHHIDPLNEARSIFQGLVSS